MNKWWLIIIIPILSAAIFIWSQGREPAHSIDQDNQDKKSELIYLVEEHLWDTYNQSLNSPEEEIYAYVALRQAGERIASKWEAGGSASEALDRALTEAFLLTRSQPDAIEICLAHSHQAVNSHHSLLSNINRGLLGLLVSDGDRTARYSPTLLLERNWSFERALEDFMQAREIKDETKLNLEVFECEQLLVKLDDPIRVISMYRGNQIVDISEVTEESIVELRDSLKSWLLNNLSSDGEMLYKYWPSRLESSQSNNMIRQWLATIALNRSGANPDLVEQNIRYNLDNYYLLEGELGLIFYNDIANLGSLALAALAIKEHPARAEFADYERSLQATIDYLWQEDGSFKTFYLPNHRNDNQNFYPGEALLYWAELYVENNDSVLLAKIMKSFEYYRAWHLRPENRNPAFVPWHTQAYFLVWQQTQNQELLEFIFKMNDWLLSLQQGDEHLPADTWGRFYDPTRPHFGPPHASSTGVYLEGLIDAYKLAVLTQDYQRATKYKESILRGLRSVLQLQFSDEVDMYYIVEKERVQGGVRTTVYNNEIRVDNVQHNLLAVLKILATFTKDDYQQN